MCVIINVSSDGICEAEQMRTDWQIFVVTWFIKIKRQKDDLYYNSLITAFYISLKTAY